MGERAQLAAGRRPPTSSGTRTKWRPPGKLGGLAPFSAPPPVPALPSAAPLPVPPVLVPPVLVGIDRVSRGLFPRLLRRLIIFQSFSIWLRHDQARCRQGDEHVGRYSTWRGGPLAAGGTQARRHQGPPVLAAALGTMASGGTRRLRAGRYGQHLAPEAVDRAARRRTGGCRLAPGCGGAVATAGLRGGADRRQRAPPRAPSGHGGAGSPPDGPETRAGGDPPRLSGHLGAANHL